MNSTKEQRRRRYVEHAERKHRRRHRDHVRDAHRWARETAGQDWVLVKVHQESTLGHVYVWAGPPGTGTKFIGYGTRHSQLFLDHMRESLAAYRAAFAYQVNDDPDVAEQMQPETFDLLDRTV